MVINIDALLNQDYLPKYSVCTLVTQKNLYQSMVNSFIAAGFTSAISEYIYIDNTKSNTTDAYGGINKFLSIARGQFIIICHQDILLEYDRIEQLESCISQLNDLDPNWGLLGNAGGIKRGKSAIRITDPSGPNRRTAKLPAKVQSLDENFILIRKDANLGASRDLHGFHLYGLDLCLQAMMRGYSAYVVDFHLRHLSPGNFGADYYACKNSVIKKYQKIFPWNYYQTPGSPIFLSGNVFLNRTLNNQSIQKTLSTLKQSAMVLLGNKKRNSN